MVLRDRPCRRSRRRMRSGPGTGAASTVFWREMRLPCRHPSSNHDEGCALNLTPGLRFYDGPMTLMTRLSAVEIPGETLGEPVVAIASSCRCRRTCKARPGCGHRRPGRRADCDGDG